MNGVLNSKIVPATYVPFVSFIDGVQLGRFGLHNGDPDDQTLIDAKFESLALAPVGDAAYPHDYFLFTVVSSRPRFLTIVSSRPSWMLTRRLSMLGGQRLPD